MYNEDKGSPVLMIFAILAILSYCTADTNTHKKIICPLDKHFQTCAFYISHGMFCSASSFVTDTDVVDAAHVKSIAAVLTSLLA